MAGVVVVELVHLRTFLAVVEHRGVRRAARRLYLSEPAVSRQVAELERGIGVALLVRTAYGTEPTPAGLALAERAQTLLDDHAEAVRRARSAPLAGDLVLGVAPAGVGELTQPLLRHLVRALPGVRLRTQDLTMLAWPDVVPPGMDLMLTRDPFADERLRVTVLLSERSAAAIPRGRPESDAHRLSLEEFLDVPYARISTRVPPAFRRFWSLQDQRGEKGGDFRGRPATQPLDAPRAVARGVGAVLGTALVARVYAHPAVRLVPVDGSPTVRTALVSGRDDHRPLVDAVHAEVAWATRRLGPLVLPELAGGSESDRAGRVV